MISVPSIKTFKFQCHQLMRDKQNQINNKIRDHIKFHDQFVLYMKICRHPSNYFTSYVRVGDIPKTTIDPIQISTPILILALIEVRNSYLPYCENNTIISHLCIPRSIVFLTLPAVTPHSFHLTI